MKIDFREIKIIAIDRTVKSYDLSIELATDIYNTTQDPREAEISRDLCVDGEIEVDAAKAVVLNKYIRKDFKAFIIEAICPILDNIINKSQELCS